MGENYVWDMACYRYAYTVVSHIWYSHYRIIISMHDKELPKKAVVHMYNASAVASLTALLWQCFNSSVEAHYKQEGDASYSCEAVSNCNILVDIYSVS